MNPWNSTTNLSLSLSAILPQYNYLSIYLPVQVLYVRVYGMEGLANNLRDSLSSLAIFLPSFLSLTLHFCLNLSVYQSSCACIVCETCVCTSCMEWKSEVNEMRWDDCVWRLCFESCFVCVCVRVRIWWSGDGLWRGRVGVAVKGVEGRETTVVGPPPSLQLKGK